MDLDASIKPEIYSHFVYVSIGFASLFFGLVCDRQHLPSELQIKATMPVIMPPMDILCEIFGDDGTGELY